MTPDDYAKLIPPEVVEALLKWLSEVDPDGGWHPKNKTDKADARAACAAMLAAWPNAWTSESVGNGSLILPLPQE